MKIELRHLLLKLLLVISLAPLCAAAAETRDAETHFFSSSIDDLKAELADARASGKRGVLIMFEQEGCAACLYMKSSVLSRKDVQDFYRKHFTNLSLDIHGAIPLRDFAGREMTEKAYADGMRIKGTPTFIFYDLKGTEIFRTIGKVEPAEFLALGRRVATAASGKPPRN